MGRTKWKQDEVERMLSFIEQCGHAEQLMASTRRRNKSIYIAVAGNLKKKRTPEQCRSKFKQLKAKFKIALKARQNNPRKTGYSFPHFEQFERLWEAAGRPQWEDRRNKGSSGEQCRPQEEPVETANMPSLAGTPGSTNKGFLNAITSLEAQWHSTKRTMMHRIQRLAQDMKCVEEQLSVP
ncbi:UNVERIFIED_CONTAM: hypothetical protein K2H54_044886 [Gekko kuhli]